MHRLLLKFKILNICCKKILFYRKFLHFTVLQGKNPNVWFMPYGQSLVKIGVDCQIFFIVVSFNCSQVLQFQFRVYSRYYKDALTQKRSFLVTCTCLVSRSNFMSVKKNQNKHSTLNLSFDTLSK